MFLPVTTFWPLAPRSSMHTKSWGGGLFGSCSLQQAELRLKLCMVESYVESSVCIAALPSFTLVHLCFLFYRFSCSTSRHDTWNLNTKVPWICHLPTGILNMYRCAFLMPSSWTEHHTWRSLIRPGDRSESGLQRLLIAKVKIMEDPFCKEGFKLVPKQVHRKLWQCMIGAVLLCVIAGEIAETNLSENVWQS